MSTPYKYLYVSHHKCATGSTKRVLRAVCAHTGLKATPDNIDWSVKRQADLISDYDFILCPNYFRGRIDPTCFPGQGFHVIRDPRDILLSQYYSHRDTHPWREWLKKERSILKKLSFDEGIRYLIENSTLFENTLRELAAWDYTSGFYETRFEVLTQHPQKEFAKIMDWLGLDIARSKLREILEANSFAASRLRNPGHYRDGRSGQWRTELPAWALLAFMDRYGDIVNSLRYL